MHVLHNVCINVYHKLHCYILTRFNVTSIWAKGRQSYSWLPSDNVILRIFQNNISKDEDIYIYIDSILREISQSIFENILKYDTGKHHNKS